MCSELLYPWLDRFRKIRTPNHSRDGIHASRATDSRLVADVPVSAPQTQLAQLEATIRSAHALLKAELNHVDKFTKYNAFHDYYLFPHIIFSSGMSNLTMRKYVQRDGCHPD